MSGLNGYGLREGDVALLRSVQEALAGRDVRPPAWRGAKQAEVQSFRDAVRGILLPQISMAELEGATERIADALSGTGILQKLLRERDIEEIYVRGGRVAIERDGRLEHLGTLAPAEYFRTLVYRIAEYSQVKLSPLNPTLLTDLPGGERFTALLPDLADEPSINIRTHGRKVRSLPDLEKFGTFEAQPAILTGALSDITDSDLRGRVAALKAPAARLLAWSTATLSASILVAGSFGSGKTTLLNALSGMLPPGAPVAILETFRELQLADGAFQLRAIAPAEHLPGEDAERITMEQVLNVVITRTSPSAVVLGEIVSAGEALQYVRAANLGRRAFATIHGGTVEAALRRLDQLALAAQPGMNIHAVRQMVTGAVDLIALMGRAGRRRYLAEITALDGLDSAGNYILHPLYRGEPAMTGNLFERAYEQLQEATQ